MAKLSGTTKLTAIALTASIVAVAAFLFLFFSIRFEVDALKELTSEVVQAQEQESKLEQLRDTVGRILDDRKMLDSYFLRERDIPSFLEIIEELGEVTGTTVKLASVDESAWIPESETDAVGEPFTTLILTISVDGSWEGVFHVLSLLESLPVPMIVHQATFDVASTKATPPLWNAGIRISVIQQ